MQEKWELVETVTGNLQAELIRGLLEAQGIKVFLSQEGAGHSVYPVLVGKLSSVQILVPSSSLQEALDIVTQLHTGDLDSVDLLLEDDGTDI